MLLTNYNKGVYYMDVNKKWKSFLNEERGRSRQRGVYKFLFMIGYTITTGDKQRGLDDIATDIRSIPNVTIVSVIQGNKNIGERQYVAGLSIKYVASTPGQFSSPEDTKSMIMRLIRRTKNVNRIYRVSPGLERVE